MSAAFAHDCMTTTRMGTFDKAAHEEFFRSFKNAMPDAHMHVVRAVKSGERCSSPGGSGERTGVTSSPPGQGTIPASGGKLDLPNADHFRVEDGLIVEDDVVWDRVTIMAQLGAAPPH